MHLYIIRNINLMHLLLNLPASPSLNPHTQQHQRPSHHTHRQNTRKENMQPFRLIPLRLRGRRRSRSRSVWHARSRRCSDRTDARDGRGQVRGDGVGEADGGSGADAEADEVCDDGDGFDGAYENCDYLGGSEGQGDGDVFPGEDSEEFGCWGGCAACGDWERVQSCDAAHRGEENEKYAPHTCEVCGNSVLKKIVVILGG